MSGKIVLQSESEIKDPVAQLTTVWGRLFAFLRTRRWELAALSAIVALAAALRLFGLPQSLPYSDNPDEHTIPDISLAMFRAGTANPHYFRWGSFSFDLQWVVTAFYDVYRNLKGIRGPYTDGQDIPVLILWGRALVALVSTATVPLIYIAGRTLFRPIVGLFAALLLAVSPMAVEYAHYLAPDTLTAFCCALCLAFSAQIYRNGKLSWYILAGAGVGLAVAAKYNIATVALCVVAAHVFYVQRSSSFAALLRRENIVRLVVSGLMALVAFAVVEPFAFLDWTTFWRDVTFEFSYYTKGYGSDSYIEGDTPAFYLHTLYTLAFPALSAAAVVVGVLLSVTRRWRATIIVALFPIAAYAMASTARLHFDRNMLPLVPALALVAAVAMIAAGELLVSVVRQPIVGIILALLVAVAVAAIPVWNGVSETRYLALPDTRIEAGRWVTAHVPKGTHIALDQDTFYLPPDYVSTYSTTRVPIGQYPMSWYIAQKYSYIVVSSFDYKSFMSNTVRDNPISANYRALFALSPAQEFSGDGAQYAGPTIRIYALPRS